MSIYIKEYLTFILIIGLVKIAVPNNRINHIIKFTSFAAMFFIIVFPILGNFKEVYKTYSAFSDNNISENSEYYSTYFKDKLSYEYIENIKNEFKEICGNNNIKVYKSDCVYKDDFLCFSATTDKLPNATFIEKFKDKYMFGNIDIRLVNEYE